MLNIKIKDSFKLIFAVSFLSLVFAYSIEYILGYQPCNLCLIERIPYWLSIILITINFIFKKNDKFLILLLMLLFFFSFIISIYHFGIEQGFFDESTVCGLQNTTKIISKEEILKQMQERTISCKDVTFRILGFSLTTINIFLSLIILTLLIKNFTHYEKDRN